jgi:hypothetical protein
VGVARVEVSGDQLTVQIEGMDKVSVAGSSARVCAIRATHSLQIHTTAMAEVLGSLTRCFAWKTPRTYCQDLPQN